MLVDCRLEDFNLDVADAELKLQSALATGQHVGAIMPVHYGGHVGDVAGVRRLARKYGLKIVEDAAHCCPAYYRERESWNADCRMWDLVSKTPNSELQAPNSADRWQPVGASADIACFSFYANKCITTGEGGMACTENDAYAERMRIMSLHGISKNAWKRFTAQGSWYYEILAPGYKYNLTDIAAAIGLHQLRRADDFHRRRTQWAGLYSLLLSDVDELILPAQRADRIHAWHLYVIRLKLDRLRINRADVIEALKQKGIGTSVHWLPLHMHPYYRDNYGYKPEDFPVAAGLYPEIISLPLYPTMTEHEVAFVCETLKSIIGCNLRHRAAPYASYSAVGA